MKIIIIKMKKILYFVFLCLMMACNKQANTSKEETKQDTTSAVPETLHWVCKPTDGYGLEV